jgi:beta-1,4-mannosyl-glycoprotein beta-1,4-N-acetylglucosaminyltransferase
MFFIDTFLFNGDWIAKLRLEYLYKYVDYFYVVESWYTFSGLRKEELFTEKYKDWFEPYLSKIKFVILGKCPSVNPWDEEHFQRNVVSQYILDDMGDKDFILSVCDCDEIYDIDSLPSKEELGRALKSGTIFYFNMALYSYNFTFRRNIPWTSAFMIHSSLVKIDTDLTKIRTNRIVATSTEIDSGWHFSYFFDVDGIQRKLKSFSHTEFNTKEINNKENIINSIKEGADMFHGTKLKFKKTAFESQKFPPLFKKYHEELLLLQTI